MKVAFVAPFYGAGAAGGAEAECRQTAIRLRRSGVDTEVHTTCLRDLHHGWNTDYHRRGESIEDGVPVHRYRSERVDRRAFAGLNARLLAGETLSADDEQRFMAQHAGSTELLRGLAARVGEYDWVCFIPYLFGTTGFGTMLCPDKAVLIPCLHDEGYAKMDFCRSLFARVARVVFHTRAEQELARRLYGDTIRDGILIGEGVDTEFTPDADRFRRRYGIGGPFVLYVGRKAREKNTDVLVRCFAAYSAGRPDVQLVLIGPGSCSIPASAGDRIVDLGFVPEQDKHDAHAAASVLCQPSVNESFSIVMMESWVCGVPCLVHEDCAVTRRHVVESGGGLYFRTAQEFGASVSFLLDETATAGRMGQAGRDYVMRNFAWDKIMRRYRDDVFAAAAPGNES